eukprot:1328507-Pleurochrysis_carterae.AAC.5
MAKEHNSLAESLQGNRTRSYRRLCWYAGALVLMVLTLASSFFLSMTQYSAEALWKAPGCFDTGCGTCHASVDDTPLVLTGSNPQFCCGGKATTPLIAMGQPLAGPKCMRYGKTRLGLRPGSCDAYGNPCSCCDEEALQLKKCLKPTSENAFAEDCIGPSWQATCCDGLTHSAFKERGS